MNQNYIQLFLLKYDETTTYTLIDQNLKNENHHFSQT